jgi:hypothetical protein
MSMDTNPGIAILWKQTDGTACFLCKRGVTLFLSIERAGRIVMEKAVESPREAIDLAQTWKAVNGKAES